MPSAYNATKERKPPTLGLVLNAPPETLDTRAFVVLKNMRHRPGRLCKWLGYRRVTGGDPEATGPVTLIDTVQWPDQSRAGVIGAGEYLYELEADHTLTALNAVAFAGGETNPWSWDQYLDTALFTNGVDVVQQWIDSAASVVALGGTPPKAESLVVDAGHVLLGRLTDPDEPWSYANSNLRLIEEWDTTVATSEADVQPLTNRAGKIMRLARLAGMVIAYKDQTIHGLRYLNPDVVYGVDNLVSDEGVLSGRGAVDLGDRHFVAGQRNLYVFNGAVDGLRPIGDRVFRWFLDTMHSESRGKVWTFHNARTREVIMAFRSAAGGGVDDLALVWNYELDAFSLVEWPFLAAGLVPRRVDESSDWDSDSQVWNDDVSPWDLFTDLADLALMTGDAGGNLFMADDGTELQADGTDIVAELQSGAFDYGEPNFRKQIGGMLLDIPVLTGSPLEVYCGTSLAPDSAITWRGPFLYDSSKRGVLNFLVTGGPWVHYRFIKRDGYFELSDYKPLVQLRGNR